MKIDNTTLRLDAAHRCMKSRNRFNSFNSTGSHNSNQHNHHQYNNSNSNLHHQQHHHHHHHNQGHHHHHNQSHQQHGSQQHHPPAQQGQNNKIILPDQTIGGQQHQPAPNHQGSHVGAGGSTSSNVSASGSGSGSGNSRVNNDALHHSGIGSSVPVAPSVAAVHHHTHAHSQQTPHTHTQHSAHPNHNLYNTPQQKNNQHHVLSENRGSKPIHGQGGDDTVSISQAQNKQQQQQPTRSTLHQTSQQQTQPTPLSQPQTQQNLSQLTNSTIGVAVPSATANITATTTAPASLSTSDVVSHSSSALPNTQHSITGQPSLVPDLRGYGHTTMMDNPHMMGTTDQQSVMPPSSMYGHIYPYGPPPPFGYMPPPPQPNPVIPISAVPPAPPNQASSSGVGQQHSLTANGNRYNNIHHQQPHHPHQAQQAHATAQDANAMNTINAGVQAPPPHQAPFYYYYPNIYFDQTGAGAPPNLYHPQTFHPQFFALPNPAYLPNAHTYPNQHQTQPPLASQSDASTTLVNQQQPQPQSHQQQVNLRTRDIDAPIE